MLLFAFLTTGNDNPITNLPTCEAVTNFSRDISTSVACTNSSYRYYEELNMVIGPVPIAPAKEVCIGYCSTDICTADELPQYNSCVNEFTPVDCEGLILPIGILNGVTYYPNNIGRSIACQSTE